MTREEMVNDNVNKFIQTIKKKPCNQYFDGSKEINIEKGELYEDALYQGYIDACRTIKGASKIGDNKKALSKTAEKIKNYLRGGNNFEHSSWCEDLIKDYESIGIVITYGHAQKIVNMAFKYLYCLYKRADKLDENMKQKFQDCHMPLDSFSLEWFYRYYQKKNCKREIEVCNKEIKEELFDRNKRIKKGSISSWSTMKSIDDYDKEYPYEFYCYNIETYWKDKGITPLELDFIVWEKMQKIMVAEEFIKVFGETPEKEVSYDWKKLDETLGKRLKHVEKFAK